VTPYVLVILSVAACTEVVLVGVPLLLPCLRRSSALHPLPRCLVLLQSLQYDAEHSLTFGTTCELYFCCATKESADVAMNL